MKKAITIRVHGYFQGTNYKTAVKEKADELHIKGSVNSDPDDSVFIDAEGEEEALMELVEYCKKPLAGARVNDVVVNDTNFQNHKTFSIKYH